MSDETSSTCLFGLQIGSPALACCEEELLRGGEIVPNEYGREAFVGSKQAFVIYAARRGVHALNGAFTGTKGMKRVGETSDRAASATNKTSETGIVVE
jgi:hypothetical protein